MGRRIACLNSVVMVLGVALIGGDIVAAGEYQAKRGTGPHHVVVLDGDWIDADRGGRDVPYRVYYPHGGADPSPVVVWSHGGGGSREGSEFLGRHLASHGYAAFHLQHRGSDIDAVRGDREGLQRAVLNPIAAVDRFQDVAFAVVCIDGMQREGPLAGRLDTTNMGVSGHSFGCITTLIAAGLRLPEPLGRTLAVPRFRAAFAMSPSPPRPGYTAPDGFAAMLMPIFHLTGTNDTSPMADFHPSARLTPFREVTNVDQYLVVFEGANHMTFTDRTEVFGQSFDYPSRARHQELIQIAAVAFWDACLRGDPAAEAWLEEGGFAAELGSQGTCEFKPAEEAR